MKRVVIGSILIVAGIVFFPWYFRPDWVKPVVITLGAYLAITGELEVVYDYVQRRRKRLRNHE